MTLCLLPCDSAGQPLVLAPPTPWTPYLALTGGQWVGGGGFTGPPRDGAVELGYFTLAGCRRRGHGRAIAAALLKIARHADPRLSLLAHTARSPRGAAAEAHAQASARILRSLGFEGLGPARDDEAGAVWRWARPASA